jgi:hypothetical protein
MKEMKPSPQLSAGLLSAASEPAAHPYTPVARKLLLTFFACELAMYGE